MYGKPESTIFSECGERESPLEGEGLGNLLFLSLLAVGMFLASEIRDAWAGVSARLAALWPMGMITQTESNNNSEDDLQDL